MAKQTKRWVTPENYESGRILENELGERLTLRALLKRGRGYIICYKSDKCTMKDHLFSGEALSRFNESIVCEHEAK